METIAILIIAAFFIWYSVYLKGRIISLEDDLYFKQIEVTKANEGKRQWTNNYQTMRLKKVKFEEMIEDFGVGNPEKMEKYLANRK